MPGKDLKMRATISSVALCAHDDWQSLGVSHAATDAEPCSLPLCFGRSTGECHWLLKVMAKAHLGQLPPSSAAQFINT